MFNYVATSEYNTFSREYKTPTTDDLVNLWELRNPFLADCGCDLFEDDETRDRWEGLDDYDKRDVYAIYDAEAVTIREALELFDDGDYRIWWNADADRSDDYKALGEVVAEETGVLEEIPERYRWYFDFEKFGRDVVFSGRFSWSDNYRVFVELY
ncbi:MAG: antirestriction protein ArdA [Thermoguttaceae bacterium]|nr:antirestriction protein ArdA [Thermoguttaceae bacterium]